MSILCVVVVTPDESLADRLQVCIEAEGHRLDVYPSTDSVLDPRNAASADLVLLDASRNSWRNNFSPAKIVDQLGRERIAFITDPGNLACNQLAAEHGITNIFTKPVLAQDLHRWLEGKEPIRAAASRAETSSHGSECLIEELPNGRFFLAGCAAMHDLYRNVRLLAPVDVPVLILGESGVGKEIVSHLLHKHSVRAQREMTDVNCAALPSELLESELFGYEAGAFTGAQKAKPGKFELAHRSTLLLDEIGEMSPSMQAKLLHVLQDGHFSRLGARVSSQVDVRVLAATNVDLEEAIAKRRFREDLYYRLNTFAFRVPALRERREEIPHLIREMLIRNAVTLNRPHFEISSQLVQLAQEYSWPGNLRELRNFITRLLVLRDERAAMSDLTAKLRDQSAPTFEPLAQLRPVPVPVQPDGMRAVVRGVKDQAEMRLISEALKVTGWNRRRAASNLQISYRALLYKIQQYGLAQDVHYDAASRPKGGVSAITDGARALSTAITA